MAGFKYTPQMIGWLREHYPQLSVEQLGVAFNARFGTDKTGQQLKSACKARGIKSGRGPGDLMRGRSKLFTPVQVQFLKDTYPKLRLPALVDAFNAEFSTEFKLTQIKAFLKNHGITCGRTGHWGERPSWNKGSAGTGLCKPNSGSFKKGDVPPNITELYTERTNRDGYIEIKVPLPNPYKKGQQTRYMLKHRWLWEQANGPVPRSHAVVFIDGDRTHCELSNLELITRAELSALNRFGYYDAPEELRPTIRALAKLDATARRKQTADPSKTQTQQVLDQLANNAMTTRQVSAETGVAFFTAAHIIYTANQRGKIRKAGVATNDSGRPASLWRACA